MGNRHDADVVVVGAGLAGLQAAQSLEAHGCEVLCLEARSRVGGRVHSVCVGGRPVDLGAEFVGPPHLRVRRLSQSLGLTLDRPDLLGRVSWAGDGGLHVRPKDMAAMAGLLRRTGRAATGLSPAAPWTSAGARDLDQQSLGGWLRTHASADAVRAISPLLAGFATREPDDLSLLHLLWLVRGPGGPVKALRAGSWRRVQQGASALTSGLAGRLRTSPALDQPVVRVSQTATGVVVETTRATAQAALAIVAVPLPVLPSIEFEPALPPDLARLARVGFGNAVSTVAAEESSVAIAMSDEPFSLSWRRSGTVKTLTISARARADGSPTGDASGPGQPETRSVNWAEDPFSRGTYLAPRPGELTELARHLRSQHGRVLFAGAERSAWPVSMEGALASGEEAAARAAQIVGAARP